MRASPIVALLLCGAARPAAAHTPGLSQGTYRVDGRRVHVDVVLARGEAAQLVPKMDGDRDGEIAEIELLQAQDALATALGAGVTIAAGDEACPGAVDRVTFVEEDGLSFAADYTCPAGQALAAFTVRLPLLGRLASGHRHLGQAWFVGASATARGPGAPGEAVDFVAHRRRSALTIQRPGAPAETPPSPPAPTSVAPAQAPGAPRWRVFAGVCALFGLCGLVVHRVRGRRRGA